jgi:hypothetical protein
MNWKKLGLLGSVVIAAVAISVLPAQAQSHRRGGGGGGSARMSSPRSTANFGHSGNWNRGSGNWNRGSGNWNRGSGNWNRGGRWSGRHHGHHGGHFRSRIFFTGFYPYGYGFYPYDWGYGYPYYGTSLYYDGYGYGYGDGRVYDGRYANSGRGSVVANVQQELARAGYYRGAIDGVIGNQTRNAIRAYERRNGLRVDGRLDDELLQSMGLS